MKLVRTAASATKVKHCTLVCPCPHISTKGWGLEVRGSQSRANSEREETEENEKRSDCS